MIRKVSLKWLARSLGMYVSTVTSPCLAQVIPDNTLPTNSSVRLEGNINVIDGGTQAGANLFHSFREFSVINGRTALFNNSLNIQNILTRVTGGEVSNINGLLQTRGDANLFLINPNGIIFGRDASLNIGGSFVASTASNVTFADGSSFGVNPQGGSLLSIAVPLGLQFPGMPANIINRSANLQVSPEKAIALVGGGIMMEGASLSASRGRIELGSVGGNSLVSLNSTNNGWILGYDGVSNFGNIQLQSQSTVSTDGVGAGNIQIQGGRVAIANNSKIVANTLGDRSGGEILIKAKDLTVVDGSEISVQTLSTGNAGKITVQADAIEVSGASNDSGKFSTIAATSRGSGNSGSIDITTNRLLAKDGADISVTTFNSGQGGNLNVNATEVVELIGANAIANSTIFSRSGLFAATEGTKDGGSITVTVPRLVVKDGARISVSTRGKGENGSSAGQGGNLTLNVRDTIDLSGVGKVSVLRDGNIETLTLPSGLFALSGEVRPNINPNEATGDGGNINIQTGRLIIRDGSQVSTATNGIGKGGDITAIADSINITGSSNISQGFSTLAADSRGSGNSGKITINTRELKVNDGADISVTAFGKGGSGTLNVNARELVELVGASAIPNTEIFSRSGLFAATEGTKDGGSITVTAPRLVVKDGARISVSTRGRGENGSSAGQGGNLTLNVKDTVDLSGVGQVSILRDGQIETLTFPSGLFALSGEVRPNINPNEATGDGGNINIQTGRLIIRDGSQVSTATSGTGKGGDITAIADSINITGSSNISQGFSTLAADSRGAGSSGKITINTRELKVNDGADISVTAFGKGGSGTLDVNARELVELVGAKAIPNTRFFSRSGLFAATEGIKDGGSITVTAPRLVVKDGARISVSTRGRGEDGKSGGKGGNLTVNVKDTVDLSGVGQVSVLRDGKIETFSFPSGLFALSGEARPNINPNEATGKGGNLNINAGLLRIRDGSQVSVSASGSGDAGNLDANVGSIKLKDASIIGSTQSENGANINLKVRDSLQLLGKSGISTNAPDQNGNGGNIAIATETLAILNDSSIRADAGRQGGKVQITTQLIFTPPGRITASSDRGAEFNGIVEIETPNVESNQELVDLPTNFLTPENLTAQSCTSSVGKNRNQFFITGRSGLPPTPEEPLSSEVVRVNGNNNSNNQNQTSLTKLPQPATEWTVNSNGSVVLTSNSTVPHSRLSTINCHVR